MRPTLELPPLEVYMLGLVDFLEVQQVQRRIVYELGESGGAALILSGPLIAWAHGLNSSIVGNLDDARITADVMGVIAQHRDLGPPNQIYVDTREHVVYLSGVVITSLIADNAEDIARQIPGVTRVVSTMGVDE